MAQGTEWAHVSDRGLTHPGDRATCIPMDCPPITAPKWVDLIGIDPDYTGGMPVGEWLDEQRGEA